MGHLDDAADIVLRAASDLNNGDVFPAVVAITSAVHEVERYIGVAADGVHASVTTAMSSGALPGGRMASQWTAAQNRVDDVVHGMMAHLQEVIANAAFLASVAGDLASTMEADSNTIRTSGTS